MGNQWRGERLFDPWHVPETDAARAVVADALDLLARYERQHGLRKRRRKAADQKRLGITVQSVICGLIHQALSGKSGTLRITRSRRHLSRQSRYGHAAFNEQLPQVLDRLSDSEIGFIGQEKGTYRGSLGGSRQTTIAPGPELMRAIDSYALTTADIGHKDGDELIILKSPKRGAAIGTKMEYDDTETTRRFRREVEEINDWLTAAEIDYLGNGDDSRCRLHRVFNCGRFDCGGRLFGGYWQSLSKADRFENLFIDGENVVELDYDQMSLNILYGMSGVEAPAGDLYAVPGYEAHRPGIKKMANAMVFAKRRFARMPDGTAEQFPAGTKVADLITAIENFHAPIRERFFHGAGYHGQFVESSIMVSVLLRLKQEGVAALPIHDAIIVAESETPLGRQIMKDAFLSHVGTGITVSEALS